MQNDMIEFSDLPISTQISSSTSFAISRATLAVICTLDFIQNKVDIAEKRGVKAMLPRLNCSQPKGLSACLSAASFCRNLVKSLSALIWPFAVPAETIYFSRKALSLLKLVVPVGKYISFAERPSFCRNMCPFVYSVFMQKRTF